MSRGYLLSLRALVLFAGLLILPLGLTLVLSFNVFDYQVGVKADEWTLAHYLALFSDAYFYKIFWRTFWISALVTLLCVVIGVPEAYILSRMGTPWRSIFLIVILTPLLISVVVRAFGWSLLLGADGLVNQVIQALGGAPDEASVYAVRRDHCVGARDAAVHDYPGVDLAAKTRPLGPNRRRCPWAPAKPR